MADQPVDDPFNPVTPQQQQGSWLDRPGIRSAILQASLQALQPVPIGQSPIGAIANSIGAGGEAFRRSVGTNIAQRKQKANETETQSQNDYRGALTDTMGGGRIKSGGPTLSQRLKIQKDQRKEWDDFLESLNADGTVNVDAMLSDPAQKKALIDQFKTRQQAAQEATGQANLMSTDQLLQDAAPQMAELKLRLARGDQQARDYIDNTIKPRLADPEALDAYLGGASSE